MDKVGDSAGLIDTGDCKDTTSQLGTVLPQTSTPKTLSINPNLIQYSHSGSTTLITDYPNLFLFYRKVGERSSDVGPFSYTRVSLFHRQVFGLSLGRDLSFRRSWK